MHFYIFHFQKTADVKVTETAITRKGRKGKQVVEAEAIEMELDEKAPELEKKSKKGKKTGNDVEQQINGTNEVVEPLAKKSKRKNIEEVPPENQSNDDNSTAEDEPTPTSTDDNELIDDQTDTNGDIEEPQGTSNTKGRKKQIKKELSGETDNKSKETGRGRKPAKQEMHDDDVVKEEKGKPIGRGRGKKAQVKPSNDSENEEVLDEVKSDPPASKGRKAKQTKTNKEKTPEADNELSEHDKEDVEEKIEEEPKKKDVKSRKNQGKKTQQKADIEDKQEEVTQEPQNTKTRRGAKKEEKNKGKK